jgi:Flp pilus assembly pilin Flp
VKFLSRFIEFESSPVTLEYSLIAAAMALALATVMPILVSSIASAIAF